MLAAGAEICSTIASFVRSLGVQSEQGAAQAKAEDKSSSLKKGKHGLH